MLLPPRLRVQRTARRLRWSAWDAGAGLAPSIDCQIAYHAQPLHKYIQGFHQLVGGSLWRESLEEHLLVAIDQMGKRLSALIPKEIEQWLMQKSHVVLEATEPLVPWELAHLGGQSLWKRLTLSRSPFACEALEKPAIPASPLNCLMVADSDGTLSFAVPRAMRWQQQLGQTVAMETLCGARAGLEGVSKSLLSRPVHMLVWNANHLAYGEEKLSHIWLHDRAWTPDQLKKKLKAPLPPLVLLVWHSLPDVGDTVSRPEQADQWAVALQEMGAQAILASAWDDASLDELWLEVLRNFARGATLFVSLREARAKFQHRSSSHSVLIYAGHNLRLASLELPV